MTRRWRTRTKDDWLVDKSDVDAEAFHILALDFQAQAAGPGTINPQRAVVQYRKSIEEQRFDTYMIVEILDVLQLRNRAADVRMRQLRGNFGADRHFLVTQRL